MKPEGPPPLGIAPAPAEDALPQRSADERATLEARWLALTREALPALAVARGWPVRADHCLQRILLDNAVGGCWYDHIAARPAYRHAPDAVLVRAVALGEAAVAGDANLAALNRRSLAWRGKRAKPRPVDA